MSVGILTRNGMKLRATQETVGVFRQLVNVTVGIFAFCVAIASRRRKMKDLFIQAHEELVNEYLEAHPNADWTEAYESVSDEAALERYRDKYADLVDKARMMAKEENHE
jgi:hypothetical protein